MGDRLLVVLMLTAITVLAVYFSTFAWLPTAWQTPGSPPLYVLGIVGTMLLLISVAFSWFKRARRGGAPPVWFTAHVIASILGMVLVAVHSGGSLTSPPALLFLVLIGLSVVGVWARTRVSRQMSATFGSRYQNFGALDANRRGQLQQIISRKQELLLRLDPTAKEGTFSLQIVHWCRKPWIAWPYAQLAREENRRISARHDLAPVQAYWRWVHIMLALVFMIGLLSHVFTVTFLAEYAAEGREIIWPHISW